LIVHLPVPSEKVSRRGKKIFESLTPSTVRDPERWDQARNPCAENEPSGRRQNQPMPHELARFSVCERVAPDRNQDSLFPLEV
jgi:hypothetical protein